MRISYICIVLCFYFSVVFTSELQTNLISIGFLDNNDQIHTLKIKQQDIQKSGTLRNLMDDILKNLMSDTSEPLKIPIKGVSSSNLEVMQEIFNVLDDVDTLEKVLKKTSDKTLGAMLTIADYLDIPIIYNNSLKIMIKRILADKEKYKDIDQDDYFGINDNHNINIKNSIKKELIKNIHLHPTFKKLHTLKGHKDPVISVALSHNGRFLVSGDSDNWDIKIWDMASKQCIGTLGKTSAITSVALSHDGDFLVSGYQDGTIKIWSMVSKQCIGTLGIDTLGNTYAVTSVTWSHDGRRIVSGDWSGTIKIWSVASKQCIGTLGIGTLGKTSAVTSVILSNDDRFLVSSHQDSTIKIWGMANQQCIGTINDKNAIITSVTLSHDDHFIVSGDMSGTIKIWSMASKQCIDTLLGHTSLISSVILSNDDRFLVSGSWDTTIKIWDMANQQCIGTIVNIDAVTSATLSHDSRFIVSGNWDGTIKIWDNITHLNTNNTIAEILGMQEKMRWKQLISMFSGVGAGISLSYLVYKYLQK